MTMVALTGPGDPLSTPDITFEIIESIRSLYPGVTIGLKTLGINSEKLAPDLAEAGVEYIELLIDAVRAEVIEKLYAWIRPGHKTLKISEAASFLLKEQQNGVPALKFHNITVSILTTLYPGCNIDHMPKLSTEMMELGADTISLIPYTPEQGTEVALNSPTKEIIAQTTLKVGKNLSIRQPLLVQRTTVKDETDLLCTQMLPKPTPEKPNIAVTSSNGIEIDLHLGQATTFLIYGPREDGLPCLLDTRQLPEPGNGKDRWGNVASVLHDCFAILTSSAGEAPRKQLAEQGTTVLLMEDNLEGTVDVMYGGGKKCKKS